MGYRKVVFNGEEYKLTPKWYKEYLSAIELDVKIDSKKPYLIRIISYINQVRNPYCYRVGDVVVRVSYAGKDKTFTDSFTEMISSIETENCAESCAPSIGVKLTLESSKNKFEINRKGL